MVFSDMVKINNFRQGCQIHRRRGLAKNLFLVYCLVLIRSAACQTLDFAQAEEFFLRNQPAEAIGLLEKILGEDPANAKAGLYLGLAYYQTTRLDEAIEVLRNTLARPGSLSALVAYNLGNVFFAKGSAAFAEPYYSQAITAEPDYAAAYLNRAQARLKMGSLKEAVADYKKYLTLEPSSSQRASIEQVIALIDNEFQAEERRRLAAETAAKMEAERRQQLLDEVAASLQAAAEQTKGLQAGGENVLPYDGEFELD